MQRMIFFYMLISVFSVEIKASRPENQENQFIGWIDSVKLRHGQYYLNGWICEKRKNLSADFNVFIEDHLGKRQVLKSSMAKYNSELAVHQVCQTENRSKSGHRFTVPLTLEEIRKYSGQKIFISGVSKGGIASKVFINGSGEFKIPHHLEKFIGLIENTKLEGQTIKVNGWLCEIGESRPTHFKLYVGDKSNQLTRVKNGVANINSEIGVHQVCQTDKIKNKKDGHRFSISLPQSEVEAFRGQKIYIHGHSRVNKNIGGHSLINSGKFLIPSPAEKVPLKGKIATIKVKEVASVGVKNFLISKVVPLTRGQYFDLDSFYLVDHKGQKVDAQFEVVNRWWTKDNSLRHIKVHFTPVLSAYDPQNLGSGISDYTLHRDNSDKGLTSILNHREYISLKDTSNKIILDNKLIKIEILKNPLRILTPAGELKSLFTKEDGVVDESFRHRDIQFDIEENGPLRSVVKISSMTKYFSPSNIKHGWALRLYFYAHSKFVKLDFQLQNSALNVPLSAPLYYRGHTIKLHTNKKQKAQSISAFTPVSQDIYSKSLGILSATDVNIFVRDFWQRFPNNISLTTSGELLVNLWPQEKGQFHKNNYVKGNLYWLDDMRHIYKEILIDFDGSRSATDIQKLGQTFQYPPVGVLAPEYYNKTKVTLDLGGKLPFEPAKKQHDSFRIPQYSSFDYDLSSLSNYAFSMDNFGIDGMRKISTAATGGTPYTSYKFYLTGNPADYYQSQIKAEAEINIRPQWLTGYQFSKDQKKIEPTANPYAGNSWRRFKGHNIATIKRDYIAGTGRTAHPRDDQHAWFYHVEDAYFQSANPWIKDWYKFIAEFRKTFLHALDPYPDHSNRARGHALSHAIAAYRVTGQTEILDMAMDHFNGYTKTLMHGPLNITRGALFINKKPAAATYQLGYLMRAYINLYNELGEKEDELLSFIENNIIWINEIARYAYYHPIESPPAQKGNGTSLSAVDPIAWYILETGNEKYLGELKNYVERGIGGVRPYGNFSHWEGQYEGRLYQLLQGL